MTDAPEHPKPQKQISRDWRLGIAVTVLVLCAATIGWLLAWGAPDNSLHASALSWSYTLVAAILAGIGIAAVAPKAIENLTSR